MCGIVGYIGHRQATEVLLGGLQRLEYRGYDSAGIALLDDGKMDVFKQPGKVRNLSEFVFANADDIVSSAKLGIAHTRWATHGLPTQANAHPHVDPKAGLAMVHNGIIDNYSDLKKQLQAKGHVFTSDTDSEVLCHLIGEHYIADGKGLEKLVQAVCAALRMAEGTFGIALACKDIPNAIIVARRGSPIVIGVGDGETIVASDASAIISHTNSVIYLNDDDVATITAKKVDIRNIDNVPVSREVASLDWEDSAAQKGGYEHFMLKEIFEQPDAIRNAIRGRVDETFGSAVLSGLALTPREMAEFNRIIVLACGTSMHAGMVGKYFFEDLADMLTDVEQAAEFRYRNPIVTSRDFVIAVSQSGETADTLAAVREAKMKGAMVAGLCNVVGSTIAREAGRGVYLHAGPEIGVASTKAFTCQVSVMLLMALKFGRCRRLSRTDGMELCEEILKIPSYVEQVLERNDDIKKIAKKYAQAHDFFFIGRGYLYPVAMEGALKLKEISYIHAEGYHAAELKHGPIALLEEKVPVVALANDLPGKDKIIGNMQECRARKAPIIATATAGDTEVAQHANDVIYLPRTSKYAAPITTVVALQMLAYHIAAARGCEIDQPRNLAKSVTVE
ncbi:MAG TPA: glutamine--fructose-6-phosphate transaminase (isomerizing) [Phycisphaerae bacterium]|nr:glutamine--fructose-6-phosphate transaminase (isomerizing) [Phycisphaerae bacterium]